MTRNITSRVAVTILTVLLASVSGNAKPIAGTDPIPQDWWGTYESTDANGASNTLQAITKSKEGFIVAILCLGARKEIAWNIAAGTPFLNREIANRAHERENATLTYTIDGGLRDAESWVASADGSMSILTPVATTNLFADIMKAEAKVVVRVLGHTMRIPITDAKEAIGGVLAACGASR